MNVVRVRVLVLEDDQPVAERSIGYYEGQKYAVAIVTPDGEDARVELTAMGVVSVRGRGGEMEDA